eukprot:SAG31_NODE_13920_length_837_cov_1.528455_1_plen_108_part_00
METGITTRALCETVIHNMLSGGRLCSENKGGLFLWVSHDGLGDKWDDISLTDVHDRLVDKPSYQFGPVANSSTEWHTQAYTSLVRTARGVVVTYNKYFQYSSSSVLQ